MKKDGDNKKDLTKWDWEANDRDFYKKFYKLPEAQNKRYFESMKHARYDQINNPNKLDFRPKRFFKVMKIELILFITGLAFAISKISLLCLALPFYSKYLNAKIREPDEINIENIKNRVKSTPYQHEIDKDQRRIEQKLKSKYTVDEEQEKIRREIDKTYEELYGKRT